MIHSLPITPTADPCETLVRRPAPHLRDFVLAYSGFRTRSAIPHRLLPCNIPVLILDITGAGRLFTGPSATGSLCRDVRWGHGVTIALTPPGVPALLGLPLRELTGQTTQPGTAGTELAERLAAIPTWPDRFALLDAWLTTHLDPVADDDPLITAAWSRLQHPDPPRVGTLAAALGVSRRRLETGFQRHIGLTPGTVTRTARFQRAVDLLARGTPLGQTATDAGYADQPHLTRHTHTLTSLTPTALRTILHSARPRHTPTEHQPRS